MKNTLLIRLALCSLLVLSSAPLFAQEKVDLGLYGGGSFFSPAHFRTTSPQPNTSVPYRFVNGGVLGVRVRENLAEHFALEQSFTFLGNNNVQFPNALMGSRLRQVYFNGNIIGFDNESKVRPYFSAGVGASLFRPTDEAKRSLGAVPLLVGAQPFTVSNDNKFHFNFGGGLKFKLTDHFGLDFSLRDFVHKNPTFGFPSPSDVTTINNLQVQGGFLIFFGAGKPPIVHTFTVAPSIEAANASLCPGESTTLRISASDSIPENRLTYRWSVKGQEVQTIGPEYQFTAPEAAGQYDVAVRVFYDTSGLDKRQLKAVRKNPGTPVDRTITLAVKEYKQPQVTVSVDRASVQRGERVRLTAKAVGSECSGKMSYRWTVNQGRVISGADQSTAELDTTGVQFDETLQQRQERRVVANLEVSDEKGGKATATQEIAVSYQPPPPPTPKAIQLSDINFGQNSDRVNNCAKRVLANELYSQMTDARYRDHDILLIGHYDAGEKATIRGKTGTSLDRERVLNTAAFLSGRGDTCKDIELSRIKVSWVGTQQTNEFKSTFCDVSTQERKADVVTSTDEKAKNRRVEIWLIPKGAEMPAGAGNVQDAPSDDIVRRGCPK